MATAETYSEPASERVWIPFPASLEAASTPVDRMVACFDGKVQDCADFFGLNEKTLYRWRRPRDKGGKGGGVPAYRVDEILQRAEEAGLPLTREHLDPSQ